jgi:putative redox protein
MHAEVVHAGKFRFESKIREHSFTMDTKEAAGGDNQGPSPKELVLSCILGCTGMDIIASLKKYRIIPQKLHISADAEPRIEHPRIFDAIHLHFTVEAAAITPDMINDAVEKSLTKYCGVSAMISKVSPIHYKVTLNGHDVGQGSADFEQKRDTHLVDY